MRLIGILLVAWLLFCILLAADVFGQITRFEFVPPSAGSSPSATVQRGYGTIGSGNSYVDVDVTAFDSTKSWVTLYSISDSSDIEDYMCTVDIVDGNTIQVRRGSANGGNLKFTYCIVTDSGLTVSRYRGSISGTDDTVAVDISTVTTAKTWLYSTFRGAIDGTFVPEYMIAQELENDTTVKYRRYAALNTLTYVLQVVSCDSCSVQRGTLYGVGTGTTYDVPIASIDSTKSFSMHSLYPTATGGSGGNDCGWYSTWYTTGGTALDTMRLVRYDNYSTYRLYWEVISFTDGSIVRTIDLGETGDDTANVTIATTDTVYASFVGGGPDTRHLALNNASATKRYHMWNYRFNNSATQVRMERYGGTLTSKGRSYIVEWKGLD